MSEDDGRIQRLRRLEAELYAIHEFHNDDSQHGSGCQSPHGGRCACGWNLIQAELEEADGNRERADFLRSTVRYAYDEDRELTEKVLRRLRADLRGEPHGDES